MSTYWQRRQNMADAAMERDERALSKRVEQVYTRELKGLEREIASYYQRYGEDNVIAYRRLMETMDPVDRDLLIRDCDKFLAVHPDMQSIVDVRKSIYKLNRLEGLQASARVHFYNVTFEVSGYVDKHLLKQSLRGANTAAEAMGFGRAFYNMDSDAVRRFVDTVWTGNTSYSQRIWDNTETLASYVAQDMAKAFARGDSYQRIAKALEKRFVDVPQSSLMRLVYTEGTYVSRMAQVEELKREGFEEYKIEAVHDGRTCEQCHGVEGKTFRFEDMQVGVNFPPIHPYCRCQIAPAVDDWDAWQARQLDKMPKQAEKAAQAISIPGKAHTAPNPFRPVPGTGSVIYDKPEADLLDHEAKTVHYLEALGYQVKVLKEDDKAPANIDLELGSKRQKWEMKNVGDGKHAVEDRMRDGYHKWEKLGLNPSKSRMVITSYGATKDEQDIIDEIMFRMKKYAVEAIYIYRDGSKSIFLSR